MRRMLPPFHRALQAGLLLVAFGLSGARPASAEAGLRVAQPDVSHFPAVRLFCFPTGPDGHVLQDVTPTQFQVTEDGRPAQVLDVQSGRRTSVAVCLVLDRSGSMDLDTLAGGKKMDAARAAAEEFVRALQGGDRAAVISFGSESSLDQSLTGDREALVRALRQHQPGGQTVLFDATYWGIKQLALRAQRANPLAVDSGLADARRAVLLLTDGHDEGSRLGFDQVIPEARANGVSLYTVGLGPDVNFEALTYLAQATGGEFYAAPQGSELAQIYDRMARRFREEYTVTFRTPRPELDGRRREVVVTVQGAALPAAATWYQAPGRGSMVATVAGGDAGAPITTTGESPAEPARPGPVLPVMLAGLGLAGAAAAGLILYGRRRAPAGRPGLSVDYGDLWTHGAVTRVGRDGTNDVVVERARVSREHALIEAENGEYRLLDLGSRNGTRVNGRPEQETAIRPGDVLEFGDARFRFTGAPPADGGPDPGRQAANPANDA